MKNYDDMDGVRASYLPLILRSPLHYQWAINNPTTSDALTFGSFYHAAILEPEMLKQRYYLIDFEKRPELDKTMASKANKAWRDQLASENEGKEGITQSLKDQAIAMRGILMGSPYPAQLVTRKGHFEESKTWMVDGVKAKGRIDKRLAGDEIILDLKTCSNATTKAFVRDAMKYHYPMKAAWYVDGWKAKGFYWIAQEKDAPYAVNVLKATDEVLNFGREQYTICINILKKCRAKYGHEKGGKQWPSYDFMEGGWPDFDLPNWAEIAE